MAPELIYLPTGSWSGWYELKQVGERLFINIRNIDLDFKGIKGDVGKS